MPKTSRPAARKGRRANPIVATWTAGGEKFGRLQGGRVIWLGSRTGLPVSRDP